MYFTYISPVSHVYLILYLMYISCITHVYLMYISRVSHVYFMYFSCISHVYLMYISCIYHVFIITYLAIIKKYMRYTLKSYHKIHEKYMTYVAICLFKKYMRNT